MGIPHPPEVSVLFIASLFSDKEEYSSVLPVLTEHFGEPLFESCDYEWDYFRYYEKELGTPVFRRFIFFRRAFDPLLLPETKLLTNSLEANHSIDGIRRINLDPGYLMLSRVVLASSKDYSHRIYIGKGIYGEVALYYKTGRFNPLPYTYYDYRDQQCLDMFGRARRKLKDIAGIVR
jgi:hypothetical protein